MSDADKLRALADWFDKYDDDRGYPGQRDVQADLRRIANNLVELERVKAMCCLYETEP